MGHRVSGGEAQLRAERASSIFHSNLRLDGQKHPTPSLWRLTRDETEKAGVEAGAHCLPWPPP